MAPMLIRLEQMVPLPVLEQEVSPSGIWNAGEVEFLSPGSYLVEAASGKGKTSLLAVIYGLRRDYQGRVLLDGRDTGSFTSRDWSVIRKKRLSFIFQGLELFPELSAMDNILLKNAITSFKSESQIQNMATRLGVADILSRKAGILSYGQQQRVAIIRALCQPFQFLLADECFSHIDQHNSQVAWELIREECHNQQAGVILTSLDEMKENHIDQRMVL